MNLFKPSLCDFNFRKIANTEILVSEVFIDRNEYEICEDFSHKMWANKKKGFYGRGMMNNNEDPRRVERTGILGEMSVAKLLDLPINVTYMEGGDQQDFVISGKRTDVKTATRNYGALLIRATYNNDLSELITLDKELYIAAYVIEDNRNEKFAKLGVVGYIPQSNLNTEYLKPARYRNANHNNWDVPYTDLTPINNLKA
jgi:hypothetical protein